MKLNDEHGIVPSKPKKQVQAGAVAESPLIKVCHSYVCT